MKWWKWIKIWGRSWKRNEEKVRKKIQEDEETKVELNEENQDILDKIFELHKFEKEKKLLILWMQIGRKKYKKINN